jgi:hypothetical protein
MNVVKLISDSDECNINQFIRCAFKNDLTVLIVSGKPSAKQLADAFDNILTEFNDLSGQSTPSEEETLLRQIRMTEARVEAMEKFIFADEQLAKLPGCPLDGDFSLYHKYGYNVSFNGNTKDFLKQLEDVKQSENSYRIQLMELKEQYQLLQTQNTNIVSTSSEVNFLKQIKNIELFYHYQLDFEKYSVKRLAILISDFREMVENQSKN